MTKFTYKWGEFVKAAREVVENHDRQGFPGSDSLYCLIDAIDRGQSWQIQKDFFKRACRSFKKAGHDICLAEYIGTTPYYD